MSMIESKVKLCTGEIVTYDGCSSEKTDYYDPEIFEYIGKGVIYSVGNVRQTFTEIDHFWRLNPIIEGGGMIEKLAEKVHDAWWDTKKEQGFHALHECRNQPNNALLDRVPDGASTKCSKCHSDMIPYAKLPEATKDYDRVTVKTVIDALISMWPHKKD